MNTKETELDSYAKINLHLDIIDKLDSGFHEIYSVFQLIGLYDRIKIKICPKGSNKEQIQIKGNFNCKTKDNLIYKIIKDFEAKSNTNADYIINIEKHIPAGGGLGGASSNAAYVLKSINKMHSNPLRGEDLFKIAEKNGSDIPFFLKAVSAVVKGRGEIINPFKADLTDYNLVITCPDFNISTQKAYDLFDKSNKKEYKTIKADSNEIKEILSKNPSDWGFFNSFTPILQKIKPVFKNIFDVFKETNADFFNITGSGSAVFGIFKDKYNASKAEKRLKDGFPFVWNGKMLAGNPLLDK